MTEDKVKEILITRPLLPDFDEFCTELKKIWDSRILTNQGPNHASLEQNLKNHLKVDGLYVYNNATIALLIAIKALDLKGEVIVTPFTFSATVHAIEWCGLTPVFCDIDPETLCIDPSKIENLITPNTCAIMAVHVYGIPCDVKKIQAIADKHNLKIIYDAAHAFGVEIDGVGIGNFGDLSVFSFHATKFFNTAEGGAITYKDKSLKDKLYLLRNFGIKSEEEILLSGINGKMNEFQALLGLKNLEILESEREKRKNIYDLYQSFLGKIEGIKFVISDISSTSYQYFPILIDKVKFGKSRDEVFLKLREHKIFARKYFYPLCSDYECYSELASANPDLLPIAQKSSQEILCLPFHGNLTSDDVRRISNIITS